MSLSRILRLVPCAAAMAVTLCALPTMAQKSTRNWQPTVQNKTYAINGQTGFELYQSIGDRGPSIGVQAIAYTTFKLTWRRDYQPQKDGSCILKSARPNLQLIYMLPKPSKPLSPATKANWDRFAKGIEVHEREHGQQIINMVENIQDYSTGLRAENDPKCQKVRAVLQKRLGEISNERQALSRDFDASEMSAGGNVHQLVLALVNGA